MPVGPDGGGASLGQAPKPADASSEDKRGGETERGSTKTTTRCVCAGRRERQPRQDACAGTYTLAPGRLAAVVARPDKRRGGREQCVVTLMSRSMRRPGGGRGGAARVRGWRRDANEPWTRDEAQKGTAKGGETRNGDDAAERGAARANKEGPAGRACRLRRLVYDDSSTVQEGARRRRLPSRDGCVHRNATAGASATGATAGATGPRPKQTAGSRRGDLFASSSSSSSLVGSSVGILVRRTGRGTTAATTHEQDGRPNGLAKQTSTQRHDARSARRGVHGQTSRKRRTRRPCRPR